MLPVDKKKLDTYANRYRILFDYRNKDRTAHVGQYLAGFFHEFKNNIERMVERVPDSDYQQLQHFISDSTWDARAVMRSVAANVQRSLEATGGEQGLLLDESGK